MSDEGTKHLVEVPPARDQQPVEAFGTRSLHPALRHRVGFRRADRGTDDLHALCVKDVIEARRELGVSVVDEKAHGLCSPIESHHEVTRLLGHPGIIGIRRAAGDGDLAQKDSYRALNCALVTWNTNRSISAKNPLKYLKERVERSNLGEEEIGDGLPLITFHSTSSLLATTPR